MISETFAVNQLSRMERMRGYPNSRAGVKDMLAAVQVANSEKLAQEAISNFLDMATSESQCPMPAEIRRWIYERQSAEDSEQKKRTRECSICRGTGWRIVERGGYSGAARCECVKAGA